MISNRESNRLNGRKYRRPGLHHPDLGGGIIITGRDRGTVPAPFPNQKHGLFHRGIPPFFQEVIDHLEGLPARTFLDLRCATGELLNMISRRNESAALYGLDISEKMVALAREKLGGRAEIRVGNAMEIPWDDNRFDVVICSKAFHYPRPLDILAEIRRVLSHCGRLVLADYQLSWPIKPLANAIIGRETDGEVKVYSKNDILQLLDRSDFHFEKWTDIGTIGFAVSALVVKLDH